MTVEIGLGVVMGQVHGDVRGARKANLLRSRTVGEGLVRRGSEDDIWQRLDAKFAERMRKEVRPAPAGWIARIARGMGLRRG